MLTSASVKKRLDMLVQEKKNLNKFVEEQEKEIQKIIKESNEHIEWLDFEIKNYADIHEYNLLKELEE